MAILEENGAFFQIFLCRNLITPILSFPLWPQNENAASDVSLRVSEEKKPEGGRVSGADIPSKATLAGRQKQKAMTSTSIILLNDIILLSEESGSDGRV